MSMSIKAIVTAAGALIVGFLVGFILGRSGKLELEAELLKAKKRSAEAEDIQKRESEECALRDRAARVTKHLLLTKEEILRATVELSASNFGLTSQHLGQSRSWLKAAEKSMKPADAKRVKKLYDDIGDAQTLAMRLDPTARVQVDQILAELQKLPGAR